MIQSKSWLLLVVFLSLFFKVYLRKKKKKKSTCDNRNRICSLLSSSSLPNVYPLCSYAVWCAFSFCPSFFPKIQNLPEAALKLSYCFLYNSIAARESLPVACSFFRIQQVWITSGCLKTHSVFCRRISSSFSLKNNESS